MTKKLKLKLVSVLPGVSGTFPGPDPGPAIAAPPAGKHFATRAVDERYLCLTDAGLVLIGADFGELARTEVDGAAQLVCLADKAIVLTASGMFRVYTIGPKTFEFAVEIRAQKPGPVWCKDGRVFTCFGARTWELTGLG